jgi:hypothetical protein
MNLALDFAVNMICDKRPKATTHRYVGSFRRGTRKNGVGIILELFNIHVHVRVRVAIGLAAVDVTRYC